MESSIVSMGQLRACFRIGGGGFEIHGYVYQNGPKTIFLDKKIKKI